MVKKAAVYLAFALMVGAVFLIAIYNQNGKGPTGVMHSQEIVASESEDAVPLAFSWVSVFVTLLLVAVIMHVISAKKEGMEKRQHVLRKQQQSQYISNDL